MGDGSIYFERESSHVRPDRIMPRKLALSSLQNRILWALEEAGEETIATLKATLLADNQEMYREIEALERLKFVERSTHDGRPSVVLTALRQKALIG